ncbi:acyl carrier protein, mitochondrial precursor,putative [Wickerhamomyces ciferrii]|uniref:Acyl carrier protein n=1 Tax=Wickerhamomyces ciferrii (strain ATCC 14091 / BCRC 22168 / CBS 111 / JCM 3599 / NBRC 0793 / NRRL Y-1031 F-60-10) TaxID=1206466 RepID=K0KL79_WICCF|nr:acyl carrier protein, mitochondrial precursor,putative [Wickerhamomyces ciferrii]CCH43741.1 acyl carrier protein, mitochondrial precursor,putative [Wickerhamomyces ciferrii]
MFRLAAQSAIRASVRSTVARSATPSVAAYYKAGATSFFQPRFYSTKLTQDDVLRRIQEATSHLVEAKTELKPEQNLTTDLGLDSLDAAEYLIAVEEEFDIEMDEDTANQLKTVGQVVEYLVNNPDAN